MLLGRLPYSTQSHQFSCSSLNSVLTELYCTSSSVNCFFFFFMERMTTVQLEFINESLQDHLNEVMPLFIEILYLGWLCSLRCLISSLARARAYDGRERYRVSSKKTVRNVNIKTKIYLYTHQLSITQIN